MEMEARTYEETSDLLLMESKDDMKLRTKKSPDIADSVFLCLHAARMRHNLNSTESAAKRSAPQRSQSLFPAVDLNARRSTSLMPVEAIGDAGGWGYG